MIKGVGLLFVANVMFIFKWKFLTKGIAMRFLFILLISVLLPSALQAQTVVSSVTAIDNVPPFINGTRTSDLLWGRHNQKYVRVGQYRYAVLQKHPIHPRDIVIYKYDESNPSAGWVEAWKKNINDGHQPPSIYVDSLQQIHLIYPKDNVGTVIHHKFTGSITGQLQEDANLIDTSIWGDRNFYFGTVYDKLTNRIYLCSNNWVGERFRCGMFVNDRWYTPHVVLQVPNHRFLYPNMYAWGHRFWVAVSSHKNGKEPSGSREISTVRRMSNYGKIKEYHTTLGNISNGTAMFENDMALNEGTQKIYVIGNYTEGQKQLYFYVLGLNSSFEKKRIIPGARGSVYNMAVRGDKIFVFGLGKFYMSEDEGETWTSGVYESSLYPKSDYVYTHASTMKPKSGSDIHPSKILLLQQVRKKSDNTKSVVSIDFSF